MARRKKNERADRIQRAITGLIISIGSIPRIYAHAEMLIEEGADDAQLTRGIRDFVGHP
jgi:hypothetical protein